MPSKKIMGRIKKDFRFLREKIDNDTIHSVLLYGSYAKNEQTPRSDIDICIVAPKQKTIKQQSKLLLWIWGQVNADVYDVRIFEAMPLSIKMSVIRNNEIIFTKDKSDLSYYFYFYRKIYNDQSVNWIEA